MIGNPNMMSPQLQLGIFLECKEDSMFVQCCLGDNQLDKPHRWFYLPGFEMFLSRNLGTLRYHQNPIYPLDN